jgi:membrane-associated phospholipid phosphatase
MARSFLVMVIDWWQMSVRRYATLTRLCGCVGLPVTWRARHRCPLGRRSAVGTFHRVKSASSMGARPPPALPTRRSPGPSRAVWVSVAIGVLVVILLGVLIRAHWGPLMEVDFTVSDELVVPGQDSEVYLLRALSAVGRFEVRLFVLGPLAVWLGWQHRWRLVALVVIGGALIGPFNEVLKVIVERPRPSYSRTIEVHGYSYPSGHAAVSAALATILVLVFWPLLSRAWRGVLFALAAIAVVAVGYSRVALGVHYTSDVVAGWCVGVGWVLVVAVLLRVWPDRFAAQRDQPEQERQPLHRRS